jgi:hypothetical protein
MPTRTSAFRSRTFLCVFAPWEAFAKTGDLDGDLHGTPWIEEVEALVGTIKRQWSNFSTNSPDQYLSIAVPASIEPAPPSVIWKLFPSTAPVDAFKIERAEFLIFKLFKKAFLN